MWIEALAALLLGATVLLLVLQPLYRPTSLTPAFEEPGQRLLLGLAIVLWARRALHRLFREEGVPESQITDFTKRPAFMEASFSGGCCLHFLT